MTNQNQNHNNTPQSILRNRYDHILQNEGTPSKNTKNAKNTKSKNSENRKYSKNNQSKYSANSEELLSNKKSSLAIPQNLMISDQTSQISSSKSWIAKKKPSFKVNLRSIFKIGLFSGEQGSHNGSSESRESHRNYDDNHQPENHFYSNNQINRNQFFTPLPTIQSKEFKNITSNVSHFSANSKIKHEKLTKWICVDQIDTNATRQSFYQNLNSKMEDNLQNGNGNQENTCLHENFANDENEQQQDKKCSIWVIKFSNCGRLLSTAGQDGLIHIWVLSQYSNYFSEKLQKNNLEGSITNNDLSANASYKEALKNNTSSSKMQRSNSSCTTSGISGEDIDILNQDKIVTSPEPENYLPNCFSRQSSLSNQNGAPIIGADSTQNPNKSIKCTGIHPFGQTPLITFKGHDRDIYDLCWNNNHFLISSSRSGRVCVWHISKSEPVVIFNQKNPVISIEFIEEDDKLYSKTFLSITTKGVVRISDWMERKMEKLLDLRLDIHVKATCMKIYNRNKNVTIGLSNGVLKFFELKYNNSTGSRILKPLTLLQIEKGPSNFGLSSLTGGLIGNSVTSSVSFGSPKNTSTKTTSKQPKNEQPNKINISINKIVIFKNISSKDHIDHLLVSSSDNKIRIFNGKDCSLVATLKNTNSGLSSSSIQEFLCSDSSSASVSAEGNVSNLTNLSQDIPNHGAIISTDLKLVASPNIIFSATNNNAAVVDLYPCEESIALLLQNTSASNYLSASLQRNVALSNFSAAGNSSKSLVSVNVANVIENKTGEVVTRSSPVDNNNRTWSTSSSKTDKKNNKPNNTNNIHNFNHSSPVTAVSFPPRLDFFNQFFDNNRINFDQEIGYVILTAHLDGKLRIIVNSHLEA